MSGTDAFEVWWESLNDTTRGHLNKRAAKLAFVAGHRQALTPNYKTYRFSAGKRQVSVKAPTIAIARKKAADTLNKRLEKQGIPPPVQGWSLTPLGS